MRYTERGAQKCADLEHDALSTYPDLAEQIDRLGLTFRADLDVDDDWMAPSYSINGLSVDEMDFNFVAERLATIPEGHADLQAAVEDAVCE